MWALVGEERTLTECCSFQVLLVTEGCFVSSAECLGATTTHLLTKESAVVGCDGDGGAIGLHSTRHGAYECAHSEPWALVIYTGITLASH